MKIDNQGGIDVASEKTYYEHLVSIRDNYDNDEALRLEILKYRLSYTILADEYTARQHLDVKLNDISSGVWLREKTLGALALVQIWMDIIRGKVTIGNPLVNAAQIEHLRSSWLENHGFRELVLKFESKLSETTDLFNLQMVNTWLVKVVRYCGELDHSLLQGLTPEIVDKNNVEADSRTYEDARFFLSTELSPMFDRIAQEAPDWALVIVFTDRQLTLIAASRMGRGVSIEEVVDSCAEKPVAENTENPEACSISDLLDEMDPFEKTEGGLWVGK